MSETAPRTNPRLENFAERKAEHEREQFENEVYGEAGTTDFSDEALARVKEADEYERHMERLAGETRSDYDRGLDRLESGKEESRAYNLEWDDAIAENEAFDAKKAAEADALEAKFAENATLRQMDAISKEIDALRDKPVDPDSADRDVRRLDELNDRLEELLGRYAESDDYDPAIADMMMDRADAEARRRAAEKALAEREGSKTADKEKELVTDPEEARALAQVEELSRRIKSDPEAAAAAGLYDELRKVIARIEEILASAKAEVKEPKDGELKDDTEEIKEPKDGDLDEIKEPKDGEPADDEELKEPKDGDLDGDEEIKTPKDGEALVDDSDDEKSHIRRGILGVWDRIGLAFAKRGGTPAGMVAYGAERLRSSKKGKVAAVIGGIAVVSAILIGRHQGWFDGGHGGSGGNGNNNTDAFTPGQKGGHPGGNGGDTIDTLPVKPTPEISNIPSGEHYAHPFNWMDAAIKNGSITPPKGMGTEQALHYYGQKAAEAGHKVEWYNLPNGLEAIRVDGSDATKIVGDVLSQFAK